MLKPGCMLHSDFMWFWSMQIVDPFLQVYLVKVLQLTPLPPRFWHVFEISHLTLLHTSGFFKVFQPSWNAFECSNCTIPCHSSKCGHQGIHTAETHGATWHPQQVLPKKEFCDCHCNNCNKFFSSNLGPQKLTVFFSFWFGGLISSKTILMALWGAFPGTGVTGATGASWSPDGLFSLIQQPGTP